MTCGWNEGDKAEIRYFNGKRDKVKVIGHTNNPYWLRVRGKGGVKILAHVNWLERKRGSQ